jgi:hypothetical protein
LTDVSLPLRLTFRTLLPDSRSPRFKAKFEGLSQQNTASIDPVSECGGSAFTLVQSVSIFRGLRIPCGDPPDRSPLSLRVAPARCPLRVDDNRLVCLPKIPHASPSRPTCLWQPRFRYGSTLSSSKVQHQPIHSESEAGTVQPFKCLQKILLTTNSRKPMQPPNR